VQRISLRGLEAHFVRELSLRLERLFFAPKQLLPLPREGGSRSTFDKLRAGETEGFSAEPERYLAA